MQVNDIVKEYYHRFVTRYGKDLNRDQWSALNAMLGCRTAQYGQIALACGDCEWSGSVFQSCGHRACNQCQYDAGANWLERQQNKLLPSAYFMVTFTVPKELRGLIKAHDAQCYPLLFDAAVDTLKQFGRNDRKLQGDLGFTSVLHTHSRALNYHPHVHFIVPDGSFHKRYQTWRTKKEKYLFRQANLAKVFRAILLRKLREVFPRLPKHIPLKWVVDCRNVGLGLPALQYLSRYLYRGVMSNKNIVKNDGDRVTFTYKDSNTGKITPRTLTDEAFIYLLLQHTLPKGFRRARDFGFLHGNARKTLQRVQLLLKVSLPFFTSHEKPGFQCKQCQSRASITHFISACDYRKSALT